jgi:hypothetical protein
VHPLTITRIDRMNRKTNRESEVLPGLVPDIIGNKILIQGHERIVGATALFFTIHGMNRQSLLSTKQGKDFFIIVKVKR